MVDESRLIDTIQNLVIVMVRHDTLWFQTIEQKLSLTDNVKMIGPLEKKRTRTAKKLILEIQLKDNKLS